ncbi:MAG: lysophospholipid acyltransferase family protein [Thiotrichales bacterium]|nr:lysophospholipid acyltransferase family protein [Thiotrichales bacterium]
MTSTPTNRDQTRQKRFIAPQYWPIWLGVGLLRGLSLLPSSAQFATGRLLGTALYWFAIKRRKTALANIQLAFPEKSAQEQKALCRAHFGSLGMSFAEMALVWHGAKRYKNWPDAAAQLVEFHGQEYLQQALESDRGLLILAPHFTTLEVTGLFIGLLTPYHAVYRPHNNPLMDAIIAKGRSLTCSDGTQVQPVANHNTRLMLKVLKSGQAMTLLPDQRYRAKGSIAVPLFGKICPSNPATSKLAKLSGCAVIPTFTFRHLTTQGPRYQVHFLPALENFPSGDDYADTLRLHHLYEQAIRQAPEQYLWVHDRWDLKRQSSA